MVSRVHANAFRIVLNLTRILLLSMPELEEFAEALFGQLSVEIDEEKEIAGLGTRIDEDAGFDVEFTGLEEASRGIFPAMKKSLEEFSGFDVSGETMQITDLTSFKVLKGRKVFATPDAREFVDDLFLAVAHEDSSKVVELIRRDTAKYFVYSTYAIQYLSKISTTYGDYMDSQIHLNEFVLSNYPKIILYKQGTPYGTRFDRVNSGYMGALKMTILEEMVHSQQEPLHEMNAEAAREVNGINEELADIILRLDNDAASSLYEYMQLQTVPDDFPMAKKANLFFMLNPDNFIVNTLGPDVMTYTKIEIDPKISEIVPELLGIYQRWLKPIQTHHAAFTTMEGMAEFIVGRILADDPDFKNYLDTFMGTEISAYRVRKSLGRDFTKEIYEKFSTVAFAMLLESPPTTRELKEPARFIERIS